MNSRITLAWIPGHIGFSNHDMVDEAAKEATSLPKITDPIPSPSSDLKSFYHTQILNLWFKDWYQLPDNKLRKIKDKPSLWSTSLRPKRLEEVRLARLRIGHTRLTHSHLLLQNHGPSSCPYCYYENLSVEHLFSCPVLEPLRSPLSVLSSIVSALSNNSQSTYNSLSYLQSTCFYPLL